MKQAVTIPWGDVASAYYSTGIGNIETYVAASPALMKQSRWLRRLAWLMRMGIVRRFAQWWIGWSISGPSAEERAPARAELWGQISDDAGNTIEAALETPDGYTFTVFSALATVERVLAGKVPAGFSTPSKAFGNDFVLTLPDTRLVG